MTLDIFVFLSIVQPERSINNDELSFVPVVMVLPRSFHALAFRSSLLWLCLYNGPGSDDSLTFDAQGESASQETDPACFSSVSTRFAGFTYQIVALLQQS